MRPCASVRARVLKFHIWIPHGKIVDARFFFLFVFFFVVLLFVCFFLLLLLFFSCPSYLPFWSYAPLKKSV